MAYHKVNNRLAISGADQEINTDLLNKPGMIEAIPH